MKTLFMDERRRTIVAEIQYENGRCKFSTQKKSRIKRSSNAHNLLNAKTRNY